MLEFMLYLSSPFFVVAVVVVDTLSITDSLSIFSSLSLTENHKYWIII